MHVEIDILGKNSDNIIIESEKTKTPEAEKPKGFSISNLPTLEIIVVEDIK